MEKLLIKLDPAEIDNITQAVRVVIQDSAKEIVRETLSQQEESTLFYTTEETSLKLGCSVPTLRTWRKLGKIKAQRIGASYMFSASAISEALSVGLKYRRP